MGAAGSGGVGRGRHRGAPEAGAASPFSPGWREDEPPHTHAPHTPPAAACPSLPLTGTAASLPPLRGSRRGASCEEKAGGGLLWGVLWPPVQPPAVSPCRAGPEYQVHRGDGREPDRASPAAFQQQAGRKVKTRVAVPQRRTQPRLLCLSLAEASPGFVRGAAGVPKFSLGAFQGLR